MAYLAERQIAMEVCPTSNVRTRAVAAIDEHPLTDDGGRRPAGDRQLRRPADVRHQPERASTPSRPGCSGYGPQGLAGLARNAVRASFLPADEQARLTAEIDRYLADATAD